MTAPCSERPRSVALLLSGDARTFVASETWRTWASHVVEPLQAHGYRVDTFLCTSPLPGPGQTAAGRDSSLRDSGLPTELTRSLRVARWLRRTTEDFDRSLFACVLDGMGCLANATALWRDASGRAATAYPGPFDFGGWLAASEGTRLRPRRRIDLSQFRFLDRGQTLCARFSTMLVRSAECYQAARAHSRSSGSGGGEYDWYMHGRPDMAWFDDAPLPRVLRPDAVSLRAREVWGHRSWASHHFRLSDNQRSHGWVASDPCGRDACPMVATAPGPCLLADDQWAWIPQSRAGAYYLAEAGCDSSERPSDSSDSSEQQASRAFVSTGVTTRLAQTTRTNEGGGVARAAWSTNEGGGVARPAWSAAALRTIYNGEGMLTARLLQLGVPMDIVPAALRFHPVKMGVNWRRPGRA